MKVFLATLVLFLMGSISAQANCSKSKICSMLGKMNHFSILDKCPDAGSLLAECKKVNETTIEDLPPGEFVDNGDGTITDTTNKLVWMRTGEHDKQGKLNKVKLKIAKKLAAASSHAGLSNWRIPSLPEFKTLFFSKRVHNAGGKKAWINPVFDDGVGHYYWTSTTCDQVSVITDRYQKKICQQGELGAWLVHFNINAVFWHHKSEDYHVWLVADLK
ncbi:MAG TPA: DUF1566 domain-containing protein [Nitrospinaceae bacterium]|jgi:hypothetical protein|nr:DUF1566 domain-containing protein [Nitrospinaceae bacterium]HIL26967.1 DUF1566 domain-containing protein [Nitrospinaceae bacterium]